MRLINVIVKFCQSSRIPSKPVPSVADLKLLRVRGPRGPRRRGGRGRGRRRGVREEVVEAVDPAVVRAPRRGRPGAVAARTSPSPAKKDVSEM